MADFSLIRRAILTSAGAFVASNLLGCSAARKDDYSVVDAYIRDMLKTDSSPGIAACVVRGDQIDWSAGYGWGGYCW